MDKLATLLLVKLTIFAQIASVFWLSDKIKKQ